MLAGRLLIQVSVIDQKVNFRPYWSWRHPFSRDCVTIPKLFPMVVFTTLLAQKV